MTDYQQPSRISIFFSRMFFRIKLICVLAGIWGVFFSVNSILKNTIGIEYDDGLVYSTPAFKAARKAGFEPDSKDYWQAVNSNNNYERTKIFVWLYARLAKMAGIKIAIYADRPDFNGQVLKDKWSNFADEFYFTPNQNDKYELLEKHKVILYAAPSDEGLIQAIKSGTKMIRIKKSSRSENTFEYNPHKFNEKILFMSQY